MINNKNKFTNGIFDNAIAKLFFVIVMLNVMFAYGIRRNSIIVLISLCSILMISIFYIYIVVKTDIQTDVHLYSGILGMYEVLHCSVIVSYRIGKTLTRTLGVLFILCLMFGIIFSVMYIFYKKSLKSSKKTGVSAVAFLPAAFIGILLHRVLSVNNFNYIIELILLLMAFCFSFFFLNLVKYKLERTSKIG